MAPYIGTATSRVDGIAKVTGAAKYAAEFNVPRPRSTRSVVTSTITKGRITRIDTSAAHGVKGVLAVLTHENRPPMAGQRQSLQGRCRAGAARRYRPLYDDKIHVQRPAGRAGGRRGPGRSRAIRGVAGAASNMTKDAFVTDLLRERRQGRPGRSDPEEPRSAAEAARRRRQGPRGRRQVRHEGEYFVPIEHHNPMELFASTVVLERRRQAHRLRQDAGRAERAALSVRRLRHEAGRGARHVALHGRRLRLGAAPAVPGACWRCLAALRAAALGARSC